MVRLNKRHLLELIEKHFPGFYGTCEWFLDRKVRQPWDGPFNGQNFRKTLFIELFKAFNFSNIIETGTYRGSTTEFFWQETRKPVYTVELDRRYFYYAKTRFRKNKMINVFMEDSRAFLKSLGANRDISKENSFFYLDAHWNLDLPLNEELRLISKYWHHPLIMIDDFEVPFDKGYGFDDYGTGKTLNLNYLQSIKFFSFKTYFPSTPSAVETGEKRGFALLVNSDEKIKRLNEFSLLRGY